jgi:hypothetical protein
MLRLQLLACILAAIRAAENEECCACQPPASPPPPSKNECAGNHGIKVGGKPCCGQPGKVSHAEHICPSHAPACFGYEHSVKFGTCMSQDEATAKAKEAKRRDNLDGDDDLDDEGGSLPKMDADDDEGGWNGTSSSYRYYANQSSAAYNWSASEYGMRSSSHLDKEIRLIVQLLGLKPGMTYCELGGGSGEWVAGVGRAVMPGGRVFVTAPNAGELSTCKVAAKRAGFVAEARPRPAPPRHSRPRPRLDVRPPLRWTGAAREQDQDGAAPRPVRRDHGLPARCKSPPPCARTPPHGPACWLEALVAPSDLGAQSEQPGGLPWPQALASACA